MFYSPYETTAAAGYRTQGIAAAIKHASIREELFKLDEQCSGVTEKTDDCPLFTQPFTERELHDSKYGIVFDVRPYTRLTGSGDDTTAVVTSPVPLESFKLRAAILSKWQTGRYDMVNAGDLPVQTFVAYVGRNIAIKLGLNPDLELKLSGMIAYYYFCLFYTAEEFDEDLQHKYLYRASKLTRVAYDELELLVSDHRHYNTINDLIDSIQKRIDSPRVNQLSDNLLFALVGGGWFGPSARENLCVALEHPATWLWLVREAVSNQSYKRTLLGKVAIQQDRKGSGMTFLKSLKVIIGR